jgi:hypothetical protein
MQYYSSMTLADYIQANWMELPKELVALFEEENERYYDQQGRIENLEENCHNAYKDLEEFRDAIEDCVDEAAFAQRSLGDLITDLRIMCKELII